MQKNGKNNLTRHARDNKIKKGGSENGNIERGGNKAVAGVPEIDRTGIGETGDNGQDVGMFLQDGHEGRGFDISDIGKLSSNTGGESGVVCLLGHSLKSAIEKSGKIAHEVKSANSAGFFHAIGKAKEVNKYGAFANQYTSEEYANMTTITTLDGTAGIAIKPSGDVVSVFNGGGKENVVATLMPIAIANGGNKLDNFSSDKLFKAYESYGFIPVSKCKFNREFAPPDWNYGTLSHLGSKYPTVILGQIR